MQLKVKLLPKQLAFLNSEKPTNLYCGGVGAGKTLAEIMVSLKYALEYPGINIIFVSPTYRMLKDVVIREAENLIPKKLIADFPKSSYPEIVFHKKHGKRSKILFRAFDDPGKVKGITAGLAILDELTEFKKEVYEEILKRLRQGGMPNRLFGATNPKDLENFVYKTIVNPYQKKILDWKDIAFFQTSSFDNYTLPDNYIKRLKRLATTNLPLYKQSVLGLWGNFAIDIIGAFPEIETFKTPYRVAFIDPSFSDSGDSDRTAASIVEVVPDFTKDLEEWEINFTGKKWEKSITNNEVVTDLLLFLDTYKPIEACLESQLGDSTNVFLNLFRQKEKDLGLTVRNHWTYKHQSKSKHERIMTNIAANKYRMKVLKKTDVSFLSPVSTYSKLVLNDDEIDSLAGGVELWFTSKVLQDYIRYAIDAGYA